ncbi:MAG: CFI-box-CTERM domain-containing protein [bacterium]|nr:CFI-box-CTERM domain-containing protein [bacterium]
MRTSVYYILGAMIALTGGTEIVIAQTTSTTTTPATRPLEGSCQLQTDFIPGEGHVITWSTNVRGGTGEYTYRWTIEGQNGGDLSTATGTFPFGDGGPKSGNVVIQSGEEEITLSCEAEPPVTINEFTPLTGSCYTSGSSIANDRRSLTWYASASRGDALFEWRGSATSTTGSSFTENFATTTIGVQSAAVTIRAGDQVLRLRCEAHLAEASQSGCFIATAAYGTSFEPEVNLLRTFRDTRLSKHPLGQSFIEAYYEVSPPLADVIRDNAFLKGLTRGLLAPVVAIVALIV